MCARSQAVHSFWTRYKMRQSHMNLRCESGHTCELGSTAGRCIQHIFWRAVLTWTELYSVLFPFASFKLAPTYDQPAYRPFAVTYERLSHVSETRCLQGHWTTQPHSTNSLEKCYQKLLLDIMRPRRHNNSQWPQDIHMWVLDHIWRGLYVACDEKLLPVQSVHTLFHWGVTAFYFSLRFPVCFVLQTIIWNRKR